MEFSGKKTSLLQSEEMKIDIFNTKKWIKTYKNGVPEMGMGYYFRSCTEHIIFGIKGKKKVLNKITKNMFMAVNPKRHSEKPPKARDMIVKCSGDIPRIELFARQEFYGWDCWGDEV